MCLFLLRSGICNPETVQTRLKGPEPPPCHFLFLYENLNSGLFSEHPEDVREIKPTQGLNPSDVYHLFQLGPLAIRKRAEGGD